MEIVDEDVMKTNVDLTITAAGNTYFLNKAYSYIDRGQIFYYFTHEDIQNHYYQYTLGPDNPWLSVEFDYDLYYRDEIRFDFNTRFLIDTTYNQSIHKVGFMFDNVEFYHVEHSPILSEGFSFNNLNIGPSLVSQGIDMQYDLIVNGTIVPPLIIVNPGSPLYIETLTNSSISQIDAMDDGRLYPFISDDVDQLAYGYWKEKDDVRLFKFYRSSYTNLLNQLKTTLFEGSVFDVSTMTELLSQDFYELTLYEYNPDDVEKKLYCLDLSIDPELYFQNKLHHSEILKIKALNDARCFYLYKGNF